MSWDLSTGIRTYILAPGLPLRRRLSARLSQSGGHSLFACRLNKWGMSTTTPRSPAVNGVKHKKRERQETEGKEGNGGVAHIRRDETLPSSFSFSLYCIRTDTSLTSPHLTFNAFPFHTFFWAVIYNSTTPDCAPSFNPRSVHRPQHGLLSLGTYTPGKDEQLPRHTHLSTPRPFLFSFPDDLAPHKLEAACHSNKKSKEKSCTAHCTLSSTRPPVRSWFAKFPCLLGTLFSPFAAFAENPQNAPPTACCSRTCVTITAHGPPPITYRTLAVITFQSYQVSFFPQDQAQHHTGVFLAMSLTLRTFSLVKACGSRRDETSHVSALPNPVMAVLSTATRILLAGKLSQGMQWPVEVLHRAAFLAQQFVFPYGGDEQISATPHIYTPSPHFCLLHVAPSATYSPPRTSDPDESRLSNVHATQYAHRASIGEIPIKPRLPFRPGVFDEANGLARSLFYERSQYEARFRLGIGPLG
ncbi:uncharacterized protein CLUP02_05626 [Colletotrichum lupini]|uniref:Uncharacterized protein n=1 Tax=Colletotrichum lupini TaxID=145971 RepID=A0A9Q8SMK4_9PEZI|nr:uncharacterized protein CLUP02_05626 [Colletotrichum lupini]UQC80144.1 hypothetical protein CLUP02_05626 [Colletotrichum lupini]